MSNDQNLAPRTRVAAATLHDVARTAGVSLATASRALNGSDRKVKEEYRLRVVAAAEELGYTANLSAQAVAKGSTMTVALLVSDIGDPYFSSIASGVIRGAEAAGLVVTIAVTDRDSERELKIVRALRGGRPRVIILAGSRFADEAARGALVAELQSFEAMGGRVVLISQGELPFPTVQLDNRSGARDLAEQLVEQGYRRFGIVGASQTLLTAKDRLDGFLEGLAAHNISVDPDHIVDAPLTRDGGYTGTATLLEHAGSDLDLVFAVTDVMAIGAMSAIRAAGFIPGEQIGVAGFDDIPAAEDSSPALTTVAVPLLDLGQRAIALALEPDDSPQAEAIVATSVVLRGSTPPR